MVRMVRAGSRDGEGGVVRLERDYDVDEAELERREEDRFRRVVGIASAFVIGLASGFLAGLVGGVWIGVG